MKTILLSLSALLLLAGTARAQAWQEDPRYGNTLEERRANVEALNLFTDAYNAQDYDRALNFMRILIKGAPRASQNIYINGGNMYTTKINQATSVAERNLYVDSLMQIYDLRAEYYGDDANRPRSYILARKAADYATFRATDRETIRKYFLDAIEATNDQDPELPTLINTYFSTLTDDYRADMVETDELLEEYDKWNGVFEASSVPAMKEGIKTLESLLIASGAADCENLEKIYKPRYEADPNNVELMQKIVTLMNRGNCDSDFQLAVAENLYKVSPEPQTGVALAAIFSQRQDYEKSLYYWQESINNESNPEMKVTYTLNAAAASIAMQNYRQAADFARQVIGIDSENGLAYMILGQAQAMGIRSNCSDSFAQRTAHWIVVDNLQRALNLLGSDSEYAGTLRQQIAANSNNFPGTDEAFFRGGLSNGDAYTVNCGWISGRTTVRVKR